MGSTTKRAEEFVNGLLTSDAADQPSDTAKVDDLNIELPTWYDKEQFDRGREFFQDHAYSFSSSMLMGLVAVFAVPSILKVLMHTKRSNSSFTAYRRYLSTMLHTMTWFQNELKPGTQSWRSLQAVRTRHARATLSSKAKGVGIVSQRDIALTMYGFIGFSVLKPHKFGIYQKKEGDWEAYNYFWKVIGHMLGLDQKYNIARSTIEETREVCRLLQARVFTPCLENVPEYFEHLSRVMLDGLWCINPTIDVEAALWFTRYLADVPGYVYSEEERIQFQRTLLRHLDGKPLDTAVPVKDLLEPAGVEGIAASPRKLYYKDYETIEGSPEYKPLNFQSRYKLYFVSLYFIFYSSYLGRLYFNLNYYFSLYLMKYFPYLAFFRFGIKNSLVNIFEEDVKDDTKPKLNAEYRKKKEEGKATRWYDYLLGLIW